MDQLIEDFVEGRALSLSFEAVQYPATAPMALAWIRRALDCAEKRGLPHIAAELRKAERRVTDHEDRLEHYAIAGQSVEPLPMWAGEGEV